MMSRISQLPNFSTPKFFPTSGTNFAPSIGGRNGLSFFFFFTFFIFPKSPRSIISNGSDLESFGALYRKFWVVEVDWFIGVPASESTLVFMGFAQFILFLWRFLTLRTPFHSNLGVIRKIMTPTL